MEGGGASSREDVRMVLNTMMGSAAMECGSILHHIIMLTLLVWVDGCPSEGRLEVRKVWARAGQYEVFSPFSQ